MGKRAEAKSKDGAKGAKAPSSTRERTACSRAGCSGSCPSRVIVRNAAIGVQTTCKVCARCFKGSPRGRGAAAGARQDQDPKKELAKALKQVEELRAQLKEAEAGGLAGGAEPGGQADGAAPAADPIKSLKAQLAALKNFDVEAAPLLEHLGGREAALAAVQAKLDAAYAEARDAKPLAARKASAEAYLRRVEEACAKAEKAHAAAQEELEEATQLAQSKRELLQAAQAKVTEAKAAVATISVEVAADLRGAASPAVAQPSVAGWPEALPQCPAPEVPAELRGDPQWEAQLGRLRAQWSEAIQNMLAYQHAAAAALQSAKQKQAEACSVAAGGTGLDPDLDMLDADDEAVEAAFASVAQAAAAGGASAMDKRKALAQAVASVSSKRRLS